MIQKHSLLTEIKRRKRKNWVFLIRCCFYSNAAREGSGKWESKDYTWFKSREVPWLGETWQSWQGRRSWLQFCQAFTLKLLSVITGDFSLPHVDWLNVMTVCLNVFRHRDWRLLGAVKQKTPTGCVTLLVVSGIQELAWEVTMTQPFSCRDQMYSNSMLYSNEAAKKSIKATLLMWVSFLKWRKLVNREWGGGAEGKRLAGGLEAV